MDKATVVQKRPWMKAIQNLLPSAYINKFISTELPRATLTLEWTYGYQSELAKSNVRYSTAGEVVYHVGKIGVVYSFDDHEQRHYTFHTDEILCLAVHPDGDTIATGEAGSLPRIILWGAMSRRLIRVIRYLSTSLHTFVVETIVPEGYIEEE
jgi:microtubule-associated protein-like 6